MKRTAFRGLGVMGLLMTWFLLAPAAQAVVPPSPTVTTPTTSDFTVLVADQPIHFGGTVAGPVSNFDQIHVDNVLPPPADPPELCNFVLVGTTNWSCDSAVIYPVGDYNLRVVWLANDPAYGDISAPTSLTLHIVAAAPPPPLPPPPPPDPVVVPVVPPVPVPIPVPIPDPVIPVVPTVPGPPTEVSAPAPTPAVAPVASTPQPTPQPKPERSAEPAQQNAAAFAPAVLIPGLPGVPADAKAALAAWNPAEHPKQVLGIGVAAFTMLNLVGPAGLALSSMAGVGVAAAAGAGAAVVAKTESRPKKGSKKGGSVKAAKVKYEKFSAEGSGVGDQSATWRIPGWEKADAWSLAVPIWLATRSPLTARILADGAYVRAMFGSAWLIGPLAGLALGMTAAHQSGGMAVPPTFALTAILLVLAIFDASWGAAGVLGFLVGMAIWPSGQLGAATQMRSFLGLAALWFAIPLIAAASRPFRRSTVSGTTYAWDRLGDAVIATLIAGWAVQKTVGGLPGLSGLDLPIAGDANKLALLAMIAVVVRVFIEEFAAWRYPLRLGAVAKGKLPFAGNRQRLLATGLRTVLFVFLAIAFIGNCWQLWVGAMLFVVPQILSIYERNFPNSPRLKALLPAGILKTLIMLIVGSYFAKLVFSILTDPDSMLRNGFLLMSLPGLALSLVGLFGHDGPDPAWTWPRQLLGGVILAATVGLVLSGW